MPKIVNTGGKKQASNIKKDGVCRLASHAYIRPVTITEYLSRSKFSLLRFFIWLTYILQSIEVHIVLNFHLLLNTTRVSFCFGNYPKHRQLTPQLNEILQRKAEQKIRVKLIVMTQHSFSIYKIPSPLNANGL